MRDRPDRRGAIGVGALGIATILLPSAARAASLAGFEPSGSLPGSGGAVSGYTLDGVTFIVHTFSHDPGSTNGSDQTPSTFTMNEARDLDVLVVGGGGGGGGTRGRGWNCGGGGGGEVVVASGVSVTAGSTLDVLVGGGGAASTTTVYDGTGAGAFALPGAASSLTGSLLGIAIDARGGGAGGTQERNVDVRARPSGGSTSYTGGGGSAQVLSGVEQTGATGAVADRAGGDALASDTFTQQAAGGGGGASGSGEDAAPGISGNGGPGVASSLATGTPIEYGSGGGGGQRASASSAGAGGVLADAGTVSAGGAGGYVSDGSAALPGRGGGGGGAGGTAAIGGAGGSGVVILRYRLVV